MADLDVDQCPSAVCFGWSCVALISASGLWNAAVCFYCFCVMFVAFVSSAVSLLVLLSRCFAWAMLGVARVSAICLCTGQAVAGSSPIVNVRLSPPASMPGIDEQVHDLESARSSLESAGLERLDASFRDAIRNAEARIEHAAADFFPTASGVVSPSGFVSLSGNDTLDSAHFRLLVSPIQAPSRAIKQKVKLLDGVRAAQESALISQGAKEMQLLVDIVVGELSSELSALTKAKSASSGSGFLESRSVVGDLDVRFLPPERPFPTIAGLVRAMDDHRAESENNVRQRIAELQLKLLQSLNSIVESTLRQHLAKS